MTRAVAILVLLLLQGCSVTQLAYENAPLFLRWQANQYFDFRGEQAAELDQRVDTFLAWHRSRALLQYARFAEEAGGRMLRGMKREDLEWGYDVLRAQVRESLDAAAAGMADLLDRLSPEQIAYFEARLVEENRKFAREQLQGTVEERRKRRLKRSLSRLEDWFGTLGDAQAARVGRYVERSPLLAELRDSDRRRRQAELSAMIRAREAKQRLAKWTVAWDEEHEPAYAAAARADRAEYFELLLELDGMLSPAQRERAAARLRDYGATFDALQRR